MSTRSMSAAGDVQPPSTDTAEMKEEKDAKQGDTQQAEGAKSGNSTQAAAQTAAVSGVSQHKGDEGETVPRQIPEKTDGNDPKVTQDKGERAGTPRAQEQKSLAQREDLAHTVENKPDPSSDPTKGTGDSGQPQTNTPDSEISDETAALLLSQEGAQPGTRSSRWMQRAYLCCPRRRIPKREIQRETRPHRHSLAQ
eukprot:3901954-Rhodomonas_salina.6